MHYSPVQENEGLLENRQLLEMEYFRGMYPESMKSLQKYVLAECDVMEYQGSPMYDEYPDQMMVHQMCRNICQSIPRDIAEAWDDMPDDVHEMEIYQIQQRRPPQGPPSWGPPSGPPSWGPPPGPPSWGPPPGPPSWGPPPGPPSWGPPPGPPSWGPPPGPPSGRPPFRPGNRLDDVIRILLLNELQRRRCRNGRCF